MSIRKYIVDIFEDEYLLAKILSLKKPKGIESDLRFLFERSFYSHTYKVPETETDNRTDLKLPLDQALLIEMKCYDGVLTIKDTQDKIKQDLLNLSSKNNSPSKKIFLYFGLYGKEQAPFHKEAFVSIKRLEEITKEIEKIYEIAEPIKIINHEYYDKTLSDCILYAAWFYLN